MTQKIRIGTRGSQLALVQADIVKNLLLKQHDNIEIEIVTITTTGDKILNKNLAEIGGKGLFIKEIEESLLSKDIDIAVHSMKDMPAIMPEEFSIACVLEREDSSDLFVSHKYKSIDDLPEGAVLGTSSARRTSQVLHRRPDIKIVPFRGNVQTRLKKLEENVADATFLAAAGINRLEQMNNNIMHIVSHKEMLPAVSQGAIGIEILSDNNQLNDLLAPLNHNDTHIRIKSERSFMRAFEGSCSTPIAANATLNGNDLFLDCLIAKKDGSVLHRTTRSGTKDDAEAMGADAAKELKQLAGDNFFD